jgi:hypothetical protein
MIGASLEVWEFAATADMAEVVRVASDRLLPASFTGHLLSTRGDAITLQLSSGDAKRDFRALYYVKGHGAFVLSRREEWPAASGPLRVLVTLLAFPRPQTALPTRHP